VRLPRTIPPAAAPIRAASFVRGLAGTFDRRTLPRLEEELKSCFGVRHVFLVSSGTAALALILLALKAIKARGRVVVPGYGCYAVPAAVVRAGLSVVPCDVDPDTLDFDYGSLMAAVDRETLCVIAIHPFGMPADIARIRAVCEREGAFLVEDAAQAMGIVHEGRMLGTSGDAGFLSLGRGKAVTCGSGGIIMTRSDAVARQIGDLWATLEREPSAQRLGSLPAAALMSMFLRPRLYWIPDGIPALGLGETVFDPDFPMWRLNRFKAGLLRDWRGRLALDNRSRQENSRFYADAFAADSRNGRCRIPRRAGDVPCIRFPILLGAGSMKDSLRRESRARRFGISPMYPDAVTGIRDLAPGFGRNTCPRAKAVADTLVTLPTHPMLGERDRAQVVACVKDALASGASANVEQPFERNPGDRSCSPTPRRSWPA
jgi:perosamine synthetase